MSFSFQVLSHVAKLLAVFAMIDNFQTRVFKHGNWQVLQRDDSDLALASGSLDTCLLPPLTSSVSPAKYTALEKGSKIV